MLIPYYSNKFEKDIKKAQKRGKNIEKLKNIIEMLINEKPLPEANRDHKLTGDLIGHRECHVEADWLLLYRIEDQTIIFVRTGTHSNLF